MTAPIPRRPLILLVEDDVRTARGLARMLVEDGYDVEHAADGRAAIVRLACDPLPDMLITDLYMPHADGLTVARFARTKNPSMPTIVVTGHAELMDETDALPASTVLVKPLDYEHLTGTLHRLLPPAA